MGTQKKFEFRYSEVEIEAFLSSDLGRLWQVLPLSILSSSVNLPLPKSLAGRKGFFTPEQAIALHFLKHHQGLSDKKLIENLSFNQAYQFFSGVSLSEGQVIKDLTILSRWRTKLGYQMDVDYFQSILQHHWKKYFENASVQKQDATCFESYIAYPTSVKLLWDAIEWLKKRIKEVCKLLKIPQPRNNYKEQTHKQRSYQLLKKPSHKQRLKRQKTLLGLCSQMIAQLVGLGVEKLQTRHQNRLEVIKTMYEQQQQHFAEPESKIPNRIVSLDRPYVRPIVRGKVNKPVEFGMKVHIYQVDNFEFIEYTSFDAFNETTRFQSAIDHHERNICPVTHTAADKIYHTNKNRNICQQKNIQNNFPKKGKPPKDETLVKQSKQMKQILSKDRSTRLEGAFGNAKNHYLARKNKARTKENEIIWIYFSVHAANASKIAQRAFA